MKKIKCFSYVESASYPGKYMICPNHELFHLDATEGSFSVICARLFSLSYADYLRMCRDCFGAEIVGKGSYYPVALFKRSEGADAIIDLLNARATMVLWEREYPDYDEHAAVVKEKYPRYYKAVMGDE